MATAAGLEPRTAPADPRQGLNGNGITTWPLAGSCQEVWLGRDPLRCQVHLPHPSVSRVQARIKLRGGSAILTSLSAGNPVYVEGRPLTLPVLLQGGERLTIGPFDLYFQPPYLTTALRYDDVPVLARGLRIEGQLGRRPLLCDVDLAVPRGKLACIIGPSGCGKSTLLKVLGGRLQPSSGTVWINRRELQSHFASIKHELAVVPQHHFFHEALTPRATLTCTARLRMSPDLSAGEIRALVERALVSVGISERTDVQLSKLSGGQRKRVALANELLADPRVVLLDEVTSGLDEMADAEIMGLMQRLAAHGKTLLCVTHNTSNIERHADLVISMAAGGHLAFLGTVAETCEYFNIERLADVYRRLTEHVAGTWQSAYRSQAACAAHLAVHLAAAPDRCPQLPAKPCAAIPLPQVRVRKWQRQFATVLLRSVRLALCDGRGTLVLAAQAVFIGLMIVLVFPPITESMAAGKGPPNALDACHVMFLLGISCFWLGCNHASKEIVRELALWRAERLSGLTPTAYLTAKSVWVLTIGAMQATLLFAIVRWFCLAAGSAVNQWMLCVASAAAGAAAGLAVSATARKESVAVGLVPLILLPQIIFGGVLCLLTGWQLMFAQGLVGVYWIYAGLRHTLPDTYSAFLPAEGRSSGVVLPVIGFHALACCVMAWWRLSGDNPATDEGSLAAR